MRTAVADFARGVAAFGRGQLLLFRHPRLAGMALLPPLLVSAVLFGALLALSTYVERVVTWLTPFLNSVTPAVAQASRWVVSMALVIGFVYIAVRMFAVLTMTLARPLYARLQRRVDRIYGGSTLHEPLHLQTRFRPGQELAQGLWRSLGSGGAVFGIGLIPAVGEIAAPVTGAVMGASNVVVELIEPAFSARGMGTLEERRQVVAAHRPSALGFGLLAYVSMLIPLVGVVLFPGAVAGATLLTREWCGEPTREQPATA